MAPSPVGCSSVNSGQLCQLDLVLMKTARVVIVKNCECLHHWQKLLLFYPTAGRLQLKVFLLALSCAGRGDVVM